MANPIYTVFGAEPTAVVFQTSGNFDGSALPDGTIPSMAPGLATYPEVAGAQIKPDDRPIKILSVTGSNGVTFTGAIEIAGISITKNLSAPFIIPLGGVFKLSSTGGSGSIKAVVIGYKVVEGNNAL